MFLTCLKQDGFKLWMSIVLKEGKEEEEIPEKNFLEYLHLLSLREKDL
jgi:hypothetical protein